MRDIQTRDDLHLLMSEFYLKLLADSKIAPVFIKVAKIDLGPHLLELVDFWQQILFRQYKLSGCLRQELFFHNVQLIWLHL